MSRTSTLLHADVCGVTYPTCPFIYDPGRLEAVSHGNEVNTTEEYADSEPVQAGIWGEFDWVILEKACFTLRDSVPPSMFRMRRLTFDRPDKRLSNDQPQKCSVPLTLVLHECF